MNKPWKIVLVLVGIFLAGSITGAFVFMRFGHHWMPRRPGPGPEQWAPNHLKRLTERLELKPEQVELIKPIVRRDMDELNRLRTESMAATKAVFQRMEQEISAQLTPEQRAKFDQMNKEFRERAKKYMPDRQNRSSGPGGPRKEGEPPPPDKPPGGT